MDIMHVMASLLGIVGVIIAIIKTTIEFKKVYYENATSKNYKVIFKNLTLSIALLLCGSFAFIIFLFILYIIVNMFLRIENTVGLLLIFVVVIGFLLIFIKSLIEENYYLRIQCDIKYVTIENQKINSKILSVSKEIECLKKNNDINEVENKISELQYLHDCKRKPDKMTTFYNALLLLNLCVSYPSILAIYIFFFSSSKHLWLFYGFLSLLIISFIFFIYTDMSKEQSDVKITGNMLKKHFKRYKKEQRKK